MKIEEVFIKGFRNLKDIPYLSTSKINAFVGDNAQGKTNLLESLYVTLRGNSFRYYSSKKDWLPANGDPFGVKLRIKSDIGNEHVVEVKQEAGSIKFSLNEKKISPTQLKKKHPIVIFSPDDHHLVRGQPEERRRYFEDVLSDGVPGYAEHLEEYEKALKNRNSLLKLARENGLTSEVRSQITQWDFLLAREAINLLQLREESWPEYKKIFSRVIHEIFHTSSVDMKWKVFQEIPTQSEYVDNLGKSLQKDIYTGWSHYGVHREDFDVFLGEVTARSSASQGQARVLAMAMRWSHAEWIREHNLEEPVFFVDDFSSELDERHRKALMERLYSTKGQVFLTGTKESFLEVKNDPQIDEKMSEFLNENSNEINSEKHNEIFAKTPKAYIVSGKILDRDFIG